MSLKRTAAIVGIGELRPTKEPGDATALAAALRELAGDAQKRRRFAEAGRRLVEGAYSDAAVMSATAALYHSLGSAFRG